MKCKNELIENGTINKTSNKAAGMIRLKLSPDDSGSELRMIFSHGVVIDESNHIIPRKETQ
ncbi:MAG TPA: hypothetical protein VK141_04030, partial [Nitrosomonas sp.]|nr:hypothetical protein [Nitrosomonas sp.]